MATLTKRNKDRRRPMPELLSDKLNFNPDYPYRLSEQGYDKLCVVKHTLRLIVQLSGEQPGGFVTLSRESLAVVTGHLDDILKGI